jgi:hypothetical protein
MIPDLVGKLYSLKLNNVSLTTDNLLNIFRSSSTHPNNRILKVAPPKGSTEIQWRPRFKSRLGGSTGKEGTSLSSTSMAFEYMEFADEPLIVVMSTHAAAGQSGILTAYVGE